MPLAFLLKLGRVVDASARAALPMVPLGLREVALLSAATGVRD